MKESLHNLDLNKINSSNSINMNTNVHKVEECTNHDGKRCTITCFSPDGSPLQGTYALYLHLRYYLWMYFDFYLFFDA